MANIYWRTIKRGARSFNDVPEILKFDVIELAKKDVVDGVITSEEYELFIGEVYAE